MFTIYFTRAALEVMPPVLLRWLMASEADVGGMAVEVEPSHQYSITCCCYAVLLLCGRKMPQWQLLTI